MSKQRQDVLEINGKIYDAKLGTVISDARKSSVSHEPRHIDGFVAPKPHTVFTPDKTSDSLSVKAKPTTKRSGANNHSRNAQKSTLLMRNAVKKPTPSVKPPEVLTRKSKSTIHTEHHSASKHQRSPFISKFNSNVSHLTKRTQHIAVTPHPDHQVQKSNHSYNHPPTSTTHKSTHSQHPQKTSKSEELFTKALEKAQPPKQNIKHKKQKKHRSTLRWGSGVIAGVLLFGFIVYLNMPNITVKFAGVRAGFSASMPAYSPSGYSFRGPAQYEAGKVTVSFKSNTDSRSYTIKQEVSNWNSPSLQENFLARNNKKFTTSQENGRTIYIYDNNATWVNGGIWYQVNSDSLSSEQLINIATSI